MERKNTTIRLAAVLLIILITLMAAVSANAEYTRTLKKGCTGADVLELQQSLNYFGFGNISLNGKYGSSTVTAVKKFQKAQKLKVDGIAGTTTLKKISNLISKASSYPKPERNLKKGDKGNDVKSVKWRLKVLGYYTGTVNTSYDSKLVTAVKKFQKDKKLTVDGKCGSKTYKKLYPSSVIPTGTTEENQETDPNQNNDNNTDQPAVVPVIDPNAVPTTYRTLKRGSSGTDVARLQAALAFLDYKTNTYGFYQTYDADTEAAVKQFQKNNGLTADGVAGSATQKVLYSGTAVKGNNSAGISENTGKMSGPALSDIHLYHWYEDVKTKLKNKDRMLIWDPATGLGWYYRVMSNGRHSDVEPETAQDTAIMYRAFGNQNDWGPKVVFVKLPSGDWTIAATHNVAHGSQTISNNNFNGQNCLHFLRTMSETTQNDPSYGVSNQNAIRAFWKALTGSEIANEW